MSAINITDDVAAQLGAVTVGAAALYKNLAAIDRLTEAALARGLDPDRLQHAVTAGMKQGRGAAELAAADKNITIEDFRAYMPTHQYIFTPTRDLWPAKSVNARLAPVPAVDADGDPIIDEETGKQKTLTASAWLDRHKPVEQMTWGPGLPELIRNRLIFEGGWIDHAGATTFNLYRPPHRPTGDPGAAGMWISHIRRVFGADANHIICWLAHRVQRPHEKVNHALVLGGRMGIGKDTMLEPVKAAIGAWNFAEVSPQNVVGNFNGFLKSVILRVSEARDLGDVDRFKFYDHSKTLIAAPPDVLRVNEKNLREHYIPNVTGVIITTNHKTDGIFLPADDRRHFVAWSDLAKEDFPDGYWSALWRWYHSGGIGHVVAYLATLDLSTFDPKAPPPKTDAFWAIVDAGHAPEDAELADVLDVLARDAGDEKIWPDAVTIPDIVAAASTGGAGFLAWITDRKNRRAIPHRMEQCGYVPVRCPSRQKGNWIVRGTRLTIYAKESLPAAERIKAAERLASSG
jgi:hypothetical protein